MTLQQAAALGLVELAAKGDFTGDSVSITVHGLPNEGVSLHVEPGDILLSKDGASQNLVATQPLDLCAPAGGTAHADGLWGSCMDLDKHIPAVGSGFDVLGPARRVDAPGMAELARVLDATRRVPNLSEIEVTAAIWAVTDGAVPGGDARAVLDAAGVAPGLTGTAHFSNPNAASPTTAAVSTVGLLAPQVTSAPPDDVPPPPRAVRLPGK
jgi:hypothetical protein